MTGHAVGEGEAGREREPAGDDRVAAVEAAAGIEEVHGAAAATAAAGGLAEHLRHDRLGRDPAGECMAVFAVRRHDRVVVREGLVDADGHGFLADVEVHETADAGRAVQLHAAFLEPADAQHRLQQGQTVRGLTV